MGGRRQALFLTRGSRVRSRRDVVVAAVAAGADEGRWATRRRGSGRGVGRGGGGRRRERCLLVGAGLVVGVGVVVELRHGGRWVTAGVVGTLRGPVLLRGRERKRVTLCSGLFAGISHCLDTLFLCS